MVILTSSPSLMTLVAMEFLDLLAECGIVSQRMPPYTPQHNGVSERRNGTLLDMVRSLMNLSDLSLSFWGYALETVACIFNMVSMKKVDKTLYEMWHGKFLESKYLLQEFSGSDEILTPTKLQTEEPSLKSAILCDSELVEEVVPTNIVKKAPPKNQENDVASAEPILRRSRRPSNPPDRYYSFLIDLEGLDLRDHDEHDTYNQAINGSKSKKWIKAMNVEMQSMQDNKVWT
ncbi:retrovirus-related pol polyprotein from transposon TNT 1-94 [Tanacetum coccineum]